eukprot:scaffold69131_cov36-Cyclotella_meneghiniana.AAC.1
MDTDGRLSSSIRGQDLGKMHEPQRGGRVFFAMEVSAGQKTILIYDGGWMYRIPSTQILKHVFDR